MFEYQVVDVLGDEEDDDDDNPVMDEGEHVYTLVLAQWYWSVCSTKVVFTTLSAVSTAWHYHYHFCDEVVNKQYLKSQILKVKLTLKVKITIHQAGVLSIQLGQHTEQSMCSLRATYTFTRQLSLFVCEQREQMKLSTQLIVFYKLNKF